MGVSDRTRDSQPTPLPNLKSVLILGGFLFRPGPRVMEWWVAFPEVGVTQECLYTTLSFKTPTCSPQILQHLVHPDGGVSELGGAEGLGSTHPAVSIKQSS